MTLHDLEASLLEMQYEMKVKLCRKSYSVSISTICVGCLCRLNCTLFPLHTVSFTHSTTVTVTRGLTVSVTHAFVSGTKKFHRGLTHLMHAQLHWLGIPDRVSYKIAT